MEVGTQIMLLREGKGFSKEQMADVLSMHVNTYKNIEYGKKIPTLDEIQKIADKLDVEASSFLSKNGSAIFKNIKNSSGTGIGNSIINDKELIVALTQSLNNLAAALEKK